MLFVMFPSIHRNANASFPRKQGATKHLARLARRGHNISVLDTIHTNDRSHLIRHIRATLPQSVSTEEGLRKFADLFWEQTEGVGTLPYFSGYADDKLGQLMLNHSTKAGAEIMSIFVKDFALTVWEICFPSFLF